MITIWDLPRPELSRLADIITGRIAMNVLASQFPAVENMQKTAWNIGTLEHVFTFKSVTIRERERERERESRCL